jgi:RNA-directed DNA polymerase
MGLERRGCIVQLKWLINQRWEESMMDTKPFRVSKRLVFGAWKRIKANCFRPREAMTKRRKAFTGFNPAISRKSLKRISTTIRDWNIQTWTGRDIDDIAKALNPVISGWLNYYKHFGKRELHRVRDMLDFAIIRWARRKFKKLSRSYRQSKAFLGRLREQQPKLFVHWYA